MLGPADDVLDHALLAGNYEGSVLEEGQRLDDPVLGFGLLVVVPLIGCEVQVAVGKA